MDDRGVFFHLIQNQIQDYFSLPVGKYTIISFGNFYYSHPHKYIPDFPHPERFKEFNFNGVILKKNYSNIATIIYPLGKIIIDEQLFYAPKPILEAVINHEIGHLYYEDEAKCDIYSAERMKEKGYNASQIDGAFQTTLYSEYRKNNIHNHLLNYEL